MDRPGFRGRALRARAAHASVMISSTRRGRARRADSLMRTPVSAKCSMSKKGCPRTSASWAPFRGTRGRSSTSRRLRVTAACVACGRGGSPCRAPSGRRSPHEMPSSSRAHPRSRPALGRAAASRLPALLAGADVLVAPLISGRIATQSSRTRRRLVGLSVSLSLVPYASGCGVSVGPCADDRPVSRGSGHMTSPPIRNRSPTAHHIATSRAPTTSSTTEAR